MMLSILSCVCWQSVYLLWRNVYLGPLSIFGLGYLCFLILSCMSCLYILEINPLSVVSFANIFFHSEGCLFVLFMVSFAVQNLLSFIRSHLFLFLFPFFQVVGQKGSCCDLCQRVLFVVRWMDLESVIQSEVSQKEKNKYHMLIHIYGI